MSSAELRAVLAGANAAAIGTGLDDNWEVFQFAEAVLVAEDTYDLSLRLRGQAGTEGAMPVSWPVGSIVAVLGDKRVTQIEMPPQFRGISRSYRVGPAGRPYDDPVYVQETRAFAGIGLRPYAPAHLRATHLPNGDLRIRWIRRTRIDGDLWDGPDVPLGEAFEGYFERVVSSGGAVIRETSVSMPEWIYSATAQVTDGASGAMAVEVAQISDRFGPGAIRRIEINV